MKRILSHYCGVFVTLYFYITIGLLSYLLRNQLLNGCIEIFAFSLPIVSGVITFIFLKSYNLKDFFKRCFRYLWMSLLTFVILEIIIRLYQSLFLYFLGAVWATDVQLGLGEIFLLVVSELVHLGLCITGMIVSGSVSFYRQIKIKQSKATSFVERKANCE
ncbi:MAG: hypothetical protein J6K51_03395 [Clostridia bacterium]|nr:hypothetical protein [Clostridia bacterium]